MPHDQAFAALTAAGYQPFDEPAQFSAQAPGGTVISTDPVAGTTVDNGGNKRVGVAASNAVTVPELSGQNVQAASTALQNLKLVPQVQSFGNDPNAQVVGQSVPGGTLVAPGTQVTIYAFL
jgi:serine/threonine-protein kinase